MSTIARRATAVVLVRAGLVTETLHDMAGRTEVVSNPFWHECRTRPVRSWYSYRITPRGRRVAEAYAAARRIPVPRRTAAATGSTRPSRTGDLPYDRHHRRPDRDVPGVPPVPAGEVPGHALREATSRAATGLTAAGATTASAWPPRSPRRAARARLTAQAPGSPGGHDGRGGHHGTTTTDTAVAGRARRARRRRLLWRR
jgi:hypothetical protein